MKTYKVIVKEIWMHVETVDANSKKEALEKICDGEGEIIDDSFEFLDDMNS